MGTIQSDLFKIGKIWSVYQEKITSWLHHRSYFYENLILFSDNDLDDLEMQVVRYKPEGLDALCKNTKFTRKELQIMYRGFKQVSMVDENDMKM